MNDYLVWSPLYKVDRTKYLYHYTSVEKAFKILYYKTLQFANITTTNDIFEQKPKLSFDETDLNTFDMVRTIQKYFLKEQNRVRILCFSQDYEKDINMENLSRDQRRANWKMSAPNLVKCSKCGALMMPHRVCKSCGSYNKKEIITVD